MEHKKYADKIHEEIKLSLIKPNTKNDLTIILSPKIKEKKEEVEDMEELRRKQRIFGVKPLK